MQQWFVQIPPKKIIEWTYLSQNRIKLIAYQYQMINHKICLKNLLHGQMSLTIIALVGFNDNQYYKAN